MTGRRRAGTGQGRRNYLPRVVGLALGAICVAGVFIERGAHPLAWGLLGFYAIAWPHLALLHTLRSADPKRAATRNLMLDAVMGGVWIVLMQFSLLPSAIVVSMLSMNNIAVGGWRLCLRGVAAILAGSGATALIVGVVVAPGVSMLEVLATLPFLIIYPLIVGGSARELARNLAMQRRELERLSRTDRLTGLSNRLHWDDWVAATFAQLRRHGGDAALLLIDIDRLNEYNEMWGYAEGDEAIRHVATVLRSECRLEDRVARYGGDEFGVLLPEIGPDKARAAAKRLRTGIRTGNSGFAGLAVSVGIAPFDNGLVDADEWMRCADKALYAAKRAGRNCCVMAEPSPESTRGNTRSTA